MEMKALLKTWTSLHRTGKATLNAVLQWGSLDEQVIKERRRWIWRKSYLEDGEGKRVELGETMILQVVTLIGKAPHKIILVEVDEEKRSVAMMNTAMKRRRATTERGRREGDEPLATAR